MLNKESSNNGLKQNFFEGANLNLTVYQQCGF